jgi:metal-responsive CopG/Arc/MetJ family transcriptional regulator
MPSSKLAVSIPDDLLREVERARRRRGLSRSAVVQTGLRAWLKAQRDAERVKRYVDAYRRHPETDEEVAEAARLVRATWTRADRQ